MQRVLIVIVVFVLSTASILALWIFRGREISSFVDRYWTVETRSAPVQSIAYEGSGTGGILIVNDLSLSLNDVSPGLSLSVGSTKDNQLALASSGKVFAFGQLPSTTEETGDHLTAVAAASDQAFLTTRHGALSWPTQFDFNFITGQLSSWTRHIYYEIRWKKPSGANLEVLWRYEQFFSPGTGWASGFMTREGSTGLIRLEIKE